MKDETFASHREFIWLWLSVLGLGALAAGYLLDHPTGGRNGGTTLGFAYGALASLGILFLMYYGVRKRYSYAAGSGTLKGWLGAHVWIGASLVLVVPLHSGFKLDLSVHSAPYFLMLLTIASGVWGAYSFLHYPSHMEGRREGMTVRGFCEQVERAAGEIAKLREGRSEPFAAFVARLDRAFRPGLVTLLIGRPRAQLAKEELGPLLKSLPKAEYEAGLQLVAAAYKKLQVENQLLAEASVAARMRVWLYVHVPLSFACVAAVMAHVFWVLFYRSSAR